MKFFLPILFLVSIANTAFSSSKTDSLLVQLKTELSRKKIYDTQKEDRIKKLKMDFNTIPASNALLRYKVCGNIYEEYKVYQFDSAYVYIQKLLDISTILKDIPKQNESKIKLGFILLSAGMFKEAFDCLNSINAAILNNDSKIEFYFLKSRAHSDLADYDNDIHYTPKDNAEAIRYIDSAIMLCKPNSYDLLMQLGNKQLISGERTEPSPYFIELLKNHPLTDHQRAMTVTGLSFFYKNPSQVDERTNLLIMGAIYDIRSSTKETLASFKLGDQLYKSGNIKDAYTFTDQAMNDAEYYGARLRKVKIGALLPVIAAQKLILIEKEKNRFLVYLLSAIAVATLISLVSFIIFNQLKRLKVKEKIIEDKNVQLEHINIKLVEDARIKEEYIGYFFNVVSGYILKLEKLKRSIDRKLATKKYDDIQVAINDINIKKERDTLFYTFDHIFLKIFPNFITVFNSLFKPEDQVHPKDNEVLNTDLRIFALIRMGITDNETIANILEYSVNTIYVYKMRIKAKAIISGEQFDQRIMSIKAVELPDNEKQNTPAQMRSFLLKT